MTVMQGGKSAVSNHAVRSPISRFLIHTQRARESSAEAPCLRTFLKPLRWPTP